MYIYSLFRKLSCHTDGTHLNRIIHPNTCKTNQSCLYMIKSLLSAFTNRDYYQPYCWMLETKMVLHRDNGAY